MDTRVTKTLDLGGSVGAIIRLSSADTAGALALVEHVLAPGGLIEPHTHTREDEFSFVLDGKIGFLIGDREFVAGAGEAVVKPRGVTHAGWNPGTTTARFLEIISPAGFERAFEELGEIVARGEPLRESELDELFAAYALAFDMTSARDLVDRYGLAAAEQYA